MTTAGPSTRIFKKHQVKIRLSRISVMKSIGSAHECNEVGSFFGMVAYGN